MPAWRLLTSHSSWTGDPQQPTGAHYEPACLCAVASRPRSVSLTRRAAARQSLETELLSALQVQVHVLLRVHVVQLRIAEDAI